MACHKSRICTLPLQAAISNYKSGASGVDQNFFSVPLSPDRNGFGGFFLLRKRRGLHRPRPKMPGTFNPARPGCSAAVMAGIDRQKAFSPRQSFLHEFVFSGPELVLPCDTTKKATLPHHCRKVAFLKRESRHLPIFAGRLQPTIFGTTELNFCVRNGNRWNLCVIGTGQICFKPGLYIFSFT